MGIGSEEQDVDQISEGAASQALAKYQKEANRRTHGSFYGLLTEEERIRVDEIIDTSYSSSFQKLYPDRELFQEAVAQNYLARAEAFHNLAEYGGFTRIQQSGKNTGREQLDRSLIICLTESNSVVLIGPGAFKSQGKGALLSYRKIPLYAGKAPDTSCSEGAFINQVPIEGERLLVDARNLVGGGIHTSRLKAAYFKETPPTLATNGAKLIGQEIDGSFKRINDKTVIFGPSH